MPLWIHYYFVRRTHRCCESEAPEPEFVFNKSDKFIYIYKYIVFSFSFSIMYIQIGLLGRLCIKIRLVLDLL